MQPLREDLTPAEKHRWLDVLAADSATIDRELSDSRALLDIMRIVPPPSSRADKSALFRHTIADFRRALFQFVYEHSELFAPLGGGGWAHHIVDGLREMQHVADVPLDEQTGVIFYAFVFCCQCLFETPVAQEMLAALRLDLEEPEQMLPVEPFLGRFRLLLRMHPHAEAEWTRIICARSVCMQYLDSAPRSSEFMALYPFHDARNAVLAFIANREGLSTEFAAFRVEACRELAHLHPHTTGAGSPSPFLAPDPPDAAWYSNKRKLADASAALSLLA